MLDSIESTKAPRNNINETTSSVRGSIFKAIPDTLNSRQGVSILSNALPQKLQPNGIIPSRDRRFTVELQADMEGFCHLYGKWHGVPC
jgi:hypothetical protein